MHWMPTLTLGSLLASGISREGPSRLPLAFVPTHRLSRLMGRFNGILTKPYDLTFTHVICATGQGVHFVLLAIQAQGGTADTTTTCAPLS